MRASRQIVRVTAEHALAWLPASLRTRIVGERYSWDRDDLNCVARAAKGEKRLLIGPANSASQGVYWANAARSLEGVEAQSLAFVRPGLSFTKDPDFAVPGTVGWYSRAWAARQRRAIIDTFTHILYESELPIIPGLYGDDIRSEIQDLCEHGIKVAMVAHGSDVRTPSQHVTIERFSPFSESLDGLTDVLEKKTTKNRAILDSLDVPKYVSTLDLLSYVPEARWLPILTDPKRWTALPFPGLGSHKLRVLHAPSRPELKGTPAIREAMGSLVDAGLIEYQELTNVRYEEMPARISWADVVIDQLAIGPYGVTGVEAMLAGRVVVAQAGDFVRSEIVERTGRDLPILEANPETIETVVRSIALEPTSYAEVARESRSFALDVHSVKRAAEALRPFLFSEAQN